MPLEQQVVSLELAKELKELGYPQESLFYWKYSNGTLEKHSGIKIDTELRYGKQPIFENLGTWYTCSTPTVAELGKLIGAGLNTRINMSGEIVVFHTLYESVFTAETEADARAKALIYLLKNKIIELK